MGQSMDLHAGGINEKKDVTQFSSSAYENIVKFKTSYYSFYLPFAVAMHLVWI